jgi:hypothetical protein
MRHRRLTPDQNLASKRNGQESALAMYWQETPYQYTMQRTQLVAALLVCGLPST